jgi:hypothetical protein
LRYITSVVDTVLNLKKKSRCIMRST